MVKKRGYHNENFIEEQAAAALIVGTVGIRIGCIRGQVIAALVAGDGGLTVADGATLTLTGKEADAVDGTPVAFNPPLTKTFTQTGSKTYAEGDVIFTFDFPKDNAGFGFITYTQTGTVSGNVLVATEYA